MTTRNDWIILHSGRLSISIFWWIMPKLYCNIQFNDYKMINDRGCAGVSDWRVQKFLLTHFPHHLSEVLWQITVKRLNQLPNSCFHQLQNYLIRLKFWPAFQGQNNLNNYFRLHVCLSIRPSVCHTSKFHYVWGPEAKSDCCWARGSRATYTQFQNHMVRVPKAKSDCCWARQSRATYTQF